MPSILFCCPITNRHVHGWLEDDDESEEDTYQTMTCLACQGVHLVNARGRVLGGDDD
jgi:hypothetical protein